MGIRLTCEAAGCGGSAPIEALDGLGRMRLPGSWIALRSQAGKGDPGRVLVACCVACFLALQKTEPALSARAA